MTTTEPRPPVRIRIRALPPLAGLDWIRRGFRTFRRQPGGFLGIFAMFMFAMLLLSVPMALAMPLLEAAHLSPVFVQIFGFVLMPLLSLGFMVGSEAVQNDVKIRPRMFFTPLTTSPAGRRSIIQIGFVYVGVLCLAYFFGNGIDGGAASAWIGDRLLPQATATLTQPPPLSDTGALVLALKMLVVALGSIPLWHAPGLIHWGYQRPAQAMFSSIVALWRTRGAVSVYLLGWFAICLVYSFALTILEVAVSSPGLVLAVAMIGSWILTTVFYITVWFGFVDTFEITSTVAHRTVMVDVNDSAG